MYIIKQNLVASENYSVKCPHSMTAEFIVVHNTAMMQPQRMRLPI